MIGIDIYDNDYVSGSVSGLYIQQYDNTNKYHFIFPYLKMK